MKNLYKQSLGVLLIILLCLISGCAKTDLKEGKTSVGIFYEVTGSGQPVILVHGFSLDRRMWNNQAELLSRNYQIIRYDLRGHGLSDGYVETFTAYDDLLSIYETLTIDKATLVGLSAGAEVAIDFALTYPERVKSLFLASPGLSGYTPEGSFEWMASVISSLQKGDVETATRLWVETPLMKIVGNPVADSVMRKIVISNSKIWTFSPALQQRLESPAINRLSEIKVPTTVLVGEIDLVDTKKVGDILAKQIQGARQVIIPGVGHLVNLAAPGLFNKELLQFLKGND